MAMDANRCGIPVVYGFAAGVGSVSYAAACCSSACSSAAPIAAPAGLCRALTACGLIAMAACLMPSKRRTALRALSIAAVLRNNSRFRAHPARLYVLFPHPHHLQHLT